MVLLGMFIVVGVVWIGLYDGGILPTFNSISATYGTGIYDPNTLTFVLTVCAFWVFILTVGGIWWLWQRSQKRDLVYE